MVNVAARDWAMPDSDPEPGFSRSPNRLDPPGIFGFEVPPRHFQVVVSLKIQPELRTVAEVEAEPKRSVRRNAPPIVDDLGDAVRRNSDRLRESALRQTISS